jgi:hypothetical protein
MGWNTTVVVLNDALHQIETDTQFGSRLARAVSMACGGQKEKWELDVPAGGHCNAATVIESHHADTNALISVGGNMGHVQALTFGWNHHEQAMQERLCREWADKLGFRLTRKRA